MRKNFGAKPDLYPQPVFIVAAYDENGIPNDDWICHCAEMQKGMVGPYAFRIDLMARQVNTLFGRAEDNLSDFAKLYKIRLS